MRYKFAKKNYKNFKVFRDNILEPRSYFIPYTCSEKALATDLRNERYSSDMVTCLSGEWDFKFYKDIQKMPDEIDTARVKFDKTHVPSDWQRDGYEEPVYLNCPYQFKTMYPSLPESMPAAIYRKKFNINSENKRYILSFLGAATNVEVYINGKYVGYSEGTHNTSEYDITDYVATGENELVVFMAKWCCGSFLEAQDMFRENGIFRDVLLSAYDSEAYVYDYDIVTEKVRNKYDARVNLTVEKYTEDTSVSVKLLDGETVLAEKELKPTQRMTAEFDSLDVEEWNAEIPRLYTLLITLKKGGKCIQSMRTYVGFKHIEIDGNVFKFNDRKVKLKGVNHHDSYSSKGYSMSLRDMERDIAIMKEYNVNAVRTSHYPPDPYFLQLCDVYGLYVIDEADIETHGLWELTNNIDSISMDLKWKHHYMDRVSRMYMRDRNHPSITMWSLGNESGGYKCQDACYDMLKATGTKIPVHYEAVIRTKRTAYDVVSEMYESIENVEKIGKGIFNPGFKTGSKKMFKEKPFYQCEYAHAMGFGPGSLEEYWEQYYAYDNLMGGCIWEFEDHAVYHYKDKYDYKYTYGGDHKEKQHDGNFCVDGLFYTNRTPHTGALEMKAVYRPLRVKMSEKKGDAFTFELWNTNCFKSAGYLTVRWSLEKNGSEIANGELCRDVKPYSKEDFTLEFDKFDSGCDYILHFAMYDGKMLVSEEQCELQNELVCASEPSCGRVSAYCEDGKSYIEFAGGRAVFDTEKGELISVQKNGREFIAENGAFKLNVMRARLDNDCRIADEWKDFGLYKMTKDVSLETVVDSNRAEVVVLTDYTAKKKDLFTVVEYYSFDSEGTLSYNSVLIKSNDEPLDLARFGVSLAIPGEFKNVEYYGNGPKENLPDIKHHSKTSCFKDIVSNMNEPYVFPQENSVHTGVRYVKFTDDCGKGIAVNYTNGYLTFTSHDYSNECLEKARHQEELVHENKTYINIDEAVRGSGTASCGPGTQKKYKIEEDMCTVSFEVKFDV